MLGLFPFGTFDTFGTSATSVTFYPPSLTRVVPLVTMTTLPFPRRTRWARFVRLFDRDFHRYAANALLLAGLITALAGSLN